MAGSNVRSARESSMGHWLTAHAPSEMRWNDLVAQRKIFKEHKCVLAGIDHALGNVYDSRNHVEIDECLVKLKKLATMASALKALGIDSTNILFHLVAVVASESDDLNTRKLTALKVLMKQRELMENLGMSTESIDTAIANSFGVIQI